MTASGDLLTVSLVATVLNEYGSLPEWIEGLRSQTLLPDECVIVDGGSDDGTVDYLRDVQLPFSTTIIQAPGCSISEGRNIAIDAAAGDLIAITDAGTRAERRWLELLVAPFRRSESVDIVAGGFVPDASSLWDRALAAATLPDMVEIESNSFLPSSRSVAIHRRLFDAGFKYPQWLDYCEDVVLDLQFRRAGATQATEIRAVVSFAPRATLMGFARQYYRYARGDGKAGLFAQRHLIRYASYAIALAILARRRPIEGATLLCASGIHLRKVIMRARRRGHVDFHRPTSTALFGLLVAVQMVIGDISKMAGYPVGLLWRAKRDGSLKLWKSGWERRSNSGVLPQP